VSRQQHKLLQKIRVINVVATLQGKAKVESQFWFVRMHLPTRGFLAGALRKSFDFTLAWVG
jgi:hypothetical protein